MKQKKTIGEWISWLIHFLLHDIFRVTEDELSKTMRFFVRLLKKLVISIRGFVYDDLIVKASALTYYTILAIVPIFALFVAVGKGFGFSDIIERFVIHTIGDNPEITKLVMGFINNYLEYTQGGLFVGFGIAILLWAVINTFRQIEANFNAIWNVNKNRSIVRQFTTYMTMLIVVPFLIVISSGLTAKVDEYVSLIADSSLGSFLVVVYQFLVKLAPFVIYWLLFTLVYVIIPNTKVKITDAMLAGVVTGTAFLAIQFVYVNGQVSLSQYNAVYGSFAAIPLLLFWLQLSWTIILYGAELCYVSQNLINFSFESDTKNISRRYKDYTLFIVLKIIISRFCQGQKPISANQIALEYNIPIRLVHDHIKLLVDTEIISEIYIEQNAERFYQPAIDVNLITVHFVFDKINRFGSENFKITDNENFSDIWQKLQALQQTINDESSKILIRDL
jgi:membrane protein